MIAALLCAVLGVIIVLAFDGWALAIPVALALLALWLLGWGEQLLGNHRRPR